MLARPVSRSVPPSVVVRPQAPAAPARAPMPHRVKVAWWLAAALFVVVFWALVASAVVFLVL